MKKWLRKIRRSIVRFFKKPEDRDTPRRTPRGVEPPIQNDAGTIPADMRTGHKIKGVLIFTGHYEEHYGTRTYNKIKEMFSNRMNAEALKQKWKLLGSDVVVETAYRTKTNYTSHCRDARKKVKAFAKKIGCKPEEVLVIEWHYNAASVRDARGGYFMAEKNDMRSVLAGKIIIDHFVENTPMTYRREYKGMKGIKGMSEGRGFGFVDYCNDYGSMSLLFEPLYCDFMNEETEWLFGKANLNSVEMEEQMRFIADKMSGLWLDALKKVVFKFNGVSV